MFYGYEDLKESRIGRVFALYVIDHSSIPGTNMVPSHHQRRSFNTEPRVSPEYNEICPRSKQMQYKIIMFQSMTKVVNILQRRNFMNKVLLSNLKFYYTYLCTYTSKHVHTYTCMHAHTYR